VSTGETGVRCRSGVLVVDDDAIKRRLLTRGLERDGHQVAAVEDGASALDT